jgi:dihydroorotate dehydrogenase (NAD+) catalytic subunit
MSASTGDGTETRVGSISLRNPVLTASGTSGHGAELGAYFDLSRLGAVVVKSLAAYPWPGNPPPRLRPVREGMVNSVGLQGPGVARWLVDDLPGLLRAGACVVASIWGRTVQEFRDAAEMLADAPPEVVAFEVNVSCPNLDDAGSMFSESPFATAAAVEAAQAAGRPRWTKLSPGVENIVPIAKAAVDAGAEALVLVNTLPARFLAPEILKPLGAGFGGLSGPALRPLALRCVGAVSEHLPGVPIVGVGGIQTGADAREFLAAGAVAVEVGTATLADPRAPVRVLEELETMARAVGHGRDGQAIRRG